MNKINKIKCKTANKNNTYSFFSSKEKKDTQPIFFQPKLTIGPTDDIYEREADAVADKVMRMEDEEMVQPKISTVHVQRKCAACEEEEKKVQLKSGTQVIQRQEESDIPSPDFTLPVPSLLQPSSGPDFLALRQPFINRSVFHLWDPDSALHVWNYNFNFFRRIGISPDLSVTFSNFTAPFFINSQLRADNPTWWEITDQELSTTTLNASLPILEFSPDFSPVAPSWFRSIFQSGGSTIRRKCARGEAGNEALQCKAMKRVGKEADHALQSYVGGLSGAGQRLPEEVRNFYEPRFGHDFSSVRVHTDSMAARSTQSINALAYTSGNNIVFNEAQYAPGTESGKRLLAHELTHVVQQNPLLAAPRTNYIQRDIFNQRDDIHDPILDQFSEETGMPRERASPHSRAYEEWIQQRTEAREAFDNHQLQPQHLTDSWVRRRFSQMTLEELLDYRLEYITNGANNTAVVTHITHIMTSRPVQPCSQTDIQRTERFAQAVLSNLGPVINNADRAMTRLHSAWISHKSSLLNGNLSLRGEVACAFKSNFNIDETNPDFGVAHIRVMNRINQFKRRLRRPVSFVCEGINHPICLSGAGLDADGFVVNHQSPIHLCIGFRDSFDPLHRQAVIIHEFLHLLPGVSDAGGYALGGFGAQTMSCTVNSKFSTATNILTNTADSIAGFILHIAQTSPTDLRVR